jgi:hypothetical protein
MCNSNMVTPTTHPNPTHIKQKIPTSSNKSKNIMKIKNLEPHFALRIHFHKTPLNIQNNTTWVFQPVNKTTIVFFYYNCNYKFMLMTM